MTVEHENRVREAANELHQAIMEAHEHGLRVDYPVSFDMLPQIAVSETGKMSPAKQQAQQVASQQKAAQEKPYDAARPLPDQERPPLVK